jgi:AraC-like DNA-binding protein
LDNTNNSENEVIEYARPPTLPGVELMTAQASPQAWRVYHEQYAVCTVDKAASDIRYRLNLRRVTNSSTLLFEPGETHVTQPTTGPQDFQVLFFTLETMRQYAEEMGIKGQLHFNPAFSTDEEVLLSCKRMQAAILDEVTEFELQSRLAECVGMLLTHQAERRMPEMSSPGRQPLMRARDFLFDQYAHALSLDEIAGIAGLSRFHFLKAFTAQFGLTPHAYQIHLRIERSLPLLRQGMSLTHVAETMGFNDQSHFIRHFKRIMGVTPGQYKGKIPVARVVKVG